MVVFLFTVKNVVCNVMEMDGNKTYSYSYAYKHTLLQNTGLVVKNCTIMFK